MQYAELVLRKCKHQWSTKSLSAESLLETNDVVPEESEIGCGTRFVNSIIF